jgi:hypothetical protein
MLCCASTNITHKIKIHIRDNSDREELIEESVDEQALDQQVSKIDSLTFSMCRGLFNSGCTINMDNYCM